MPDIKASAARFDDGNVCVTMITVHEYLQSGGSCPYREWFDRLPPQAAGKVATAIFRLTLGNTSSIKWFAGVGEIRIDWGPGYRVYLIRVDPSRMLLLCGGTKASQASDIERAKALREEHRKRRDPG